ncbi:MAG: TonB-dependent receptor [Bacteroidetes bacterium]|nr:TonB-dependent receptor [Bacteroidota bacterium]
MKTNYSVRFMIAVMLVLSGTMQLIAGEATKFTVQGTIIDEETKETLIGVSVFLQDRSAGTTTDINGKFSLDVNANDSRSLIEVSYVGYEKKTVDVANDGKAITIALHVSQKMMKEVVVSASRVSERIMASPVTIEKINSRNISETTAQNFYESVGNLKSIDVVTSGISYKTINIRGFGNTEKPGFVQLVDGMDNQSPGLNYSVGYSIIDLDVENIEVIPGTASALYGANAFNGLMSITSKNPFNRQGISVQIKNGVNHVDGTDHTPALLNDFQIRIAKAFNKHIAFKVNAEYFKGQDWVANDSRDVSLYKPTGVESKDDPSYDGLNVYGDEISTPLPIGTNGAPIVISRTGYDEKDLMNYNSHYIKLDGALHYRFNDKVEASYTYKYSLSNAILHSSNRYALKDLGLTQQKIQLTAPNFFFRAYTNGENSGKTYDSRFLAINMNNAWKTNDQWFTDYAYAYLGYIPGVNANDFGAARSFADDGRPMPGTDRFNQLKDSVASVVGFGKGGASFDDHTKLYHAESQYDFTKAIKFMELQVGGSVRYFALDSKGTLYADTAGNPLHFYEYGAYTQVAKKIFSDKLKLTASLRYDKSQNYIGEFSPRVSAVYNVSKDNFVRASYQTGFRMPTSQDQYIDLDLGFMRIIGGLPSIANTHDVAGKVFTLESISDYGNAVTDYVNTYGTDSSVAAIEKYKGKLVPLDYKYVKPEHVQSFELGYKGLLNENNLFYDISLYYTINHDFIGYYNVARPNSGSTENADSITAAAYSFATETATYYQLTSNLAGDVNTYGAALGLTYNLPKSFVISGNVTYSRIDKSATGRTLFNTPTYKTNLGIGNRNIFKNVGFAINWRWMDTYKWESLFGDGMLASSNTVDAQMSYKFPKVATTVKVGATNAFNNRHTEVYGGGTVGGVYYLSLVYDGIFK